MIVERSEIPRIGAEGQLVADLENAVAEYLGMKGGVANSKGGALCPPRHDGAFLRCTHKGYTLRRRWIFLMAMK